MENERFIRHKYNLHMAPITGFIFPVYVHSYLGSKLFKVPVMIKLRNCSELLTHAAVIPLD